MGNGNYQSSQIPSLINYGKHGRLTVRSVKLFTDGIHSPSLSLDTHLAPCTRSSGFMGSSPPLAILR